jgi:arylsulfatase A-like enzyme
MPRALIPLLVLGLAIAGACRPHAPADVPLAISLVESFAPEAVEGRRPLPTPPRTEWSFAALAPELSWTPGPGVRELAMRDGALTGTAAGNRPVVELLAASPLGAGDVLHAIEVRMSCSAGGTLIVNTLGESGPPTAVFGTPAAPNGLTTPLLGDGMQTYSFPLATSFAAAAPLERSRIRRVVLRPTDAAGASFAIESVRLVFRREHLAAVPSGIGWRGLGEVWRESVVTRPGETVRLALRLPAHPVLDLALGTLSELPVAFRVAVRPAGGEEGEEGEERVVLRHTVTAADQWHPDPVPLDAWAGEEVELMLRAEIAGEGGAESAVKDEALAFWGSPVVRSRGAGSAAAEADRPQGVILIIADTLRRDHLDAWGYERPTAPVVHGLARQGVQFTDAIAQAVWTKVSVPSILSSLYPATHGITDFTHRLPASATTLAEAYRAAGYATFGTSTIPFTGQLTNLHQGLEVLHESRSFRPPVEEQFMKSAREYVSRTLAFVEQHRDVPFFVQLHVADPHAPYRPFEPYDRLWTDPADLQWFREAEEKVREQMPARTARRRSAAATAEELRRAGVDAPRYVRHGKGWYDGSIRAMDAEIGRLMDRLEHLGLADRVLLAFVSDHGEEFLEHGSHWHGQNVYGENANVPMVLWGPRFLPQGVKVAPTVQLVDLMPTLLELSGLPAPPEVQGRSLLPLARGAGAGQVPEGWREHPAFTERRYIPSIGPQPDVHPGWAMVQGRWKLVQLAPPAPGRAELELYDHRADPLNLRDVGAAHPDVVQAMAGQLARWRGWAEGRRLPPDDAASMDAAELEKLRSLGYVN